MSDTSVNPNIPVTEVQTSTTGSGKVELGSSESALTFDELEEVLSEKKTVKAKAKKEAEGKEDEPEAKAKPNESGSKDLTADDRKGEKSDKDDKDKEPTEKESESEAKAKDAEAKQLRKAIRAKLADKEFDLDEESLVPVKINGKEEMIPVKELLGNYSGKVAWDKRFTELSKKEKQNSSNELKFRQAAENFKGALMEEDLDVRMFKIASMAGVDPIEYRTKYLGEQINLLEKWYSMSEDERKADAQTYEAKFHKHRADTLESSIKTEHAQKALQSKIDNLRASHQISEDEFVEQYEAINQLIKSGELDESHRTPEKIVETVQKERLWSAVDQSLSSLDLPWSVQERNSQMYKLVDNAHKIGLKPIDMAEMVEEVWGQKKAQKKVQTIREERQEFNSGKKPVEQMKAKADSAVFFDDMT